MFTLNMQKVWFIDHRWIFQIFQFWKIDLTVVRNPHTNAGDTGLIPGLERSPLEKEMATHSSVLAWEIPWTDEPGGLQSTRLQRVRHYLVTKQQKNCVSSGHFYLYSPMLKARYLPCTWQDCYTATILSWFMEVTEVEIRVKRL